ncbi:hypothetical protein MBAV_001645 [Candidatus Magnetobacterium bavaricum]|uniref:Uncharacterized protein n=1 Tax=Candidatus Magnetobacterium bavaricum TaxID=29290 RepID=A0A0F3GW94_9BACT|nr:hypothetical protein MBAV_001645 [Candidatus Magnetobacterium bavaricum]
MRLTNELQIWEQFKDAITNDVPVSLRMNVPKGTHRNIYTVLLHEGKTPDQYDYLRYEEPLALTQVQKIAEQAHREEITGIDIDNKDTGA